MDAIEFDVNDQEIEESGSDHRIKVNTAATAEEEPDTFTTTEGNSINKNDSNVIEDSTHIESESESDSVADGLTTTTTTTTTTTIKELGGSDNKTTPHTSLSSSSSSKDKKNSKQIGKNKTQTPHPPPPPPPPPAQEGTAKQHQKKISKKKLKKYADQDDEDRELAMMALGHKKIPLKPKETHLELKKAQVKASLQMGSDKSTSWEENIASTLTPQVYDKINSMVSEGTLKSGEIDMIEIRALATFGDEKALHILELFRQGLVSKRVGNKSGYFAGIIAQVVI